MSVEFCLLRRAKRDIANDRYCKILLADDDPQDKEIIKDEFRDHGHSHVVSLLENGEGVLAFLQSITQGMPGRMAHKR